MSGTFITDGSTVYGFDPDGVRIPIAKAESATWAEVIAELLTADLNTYVVGLWG